MKKNILTLLILTLITVYLFKESILIKESILEACNLFFNKVFPSLFPMFILCDLFMYANLPQILANLFGGIFTKIFHTSPYGAYAFFISLFSGTPANAYALKEMVKENKLNTTEASYILSFSFFSNPLFYYSMLKLIFTNNYTIIKLFIAPYLTNIFIGFITREKQVSKKTTFNNYIPKKTLSTTLINSLKKSTSTMLLILASITLFFIINALINPNNHLFLSGILEVSQGLNKLITSNYSTKLKELLVLIFVSFGGLSIHLQITSILEDTKINIKSFFKARLLESLLSFIWLFI